MRDAWNFQGRGSGTGGDEDVNGFLVIVVLLLLVLGAAKRPPLGLFPGCSDSESSIPQTDHTTTTTRRTLRRRVLVLAGG